MKFVFILLLGLLLSGCNYIHADQVVGSGNTRIEKREVASFDSIDASGAIDIDVVCQKEASLEIEGDDNLLPLLKTEVRGGTLYIKSDKSFSARNAIRIRITAPNIQSISSTGAGNFTVSNIKNERMKIQNTGASNINLSGETGALEMELTGASKADTEKLKAERVTVNLSGAGKANVYASAELNAEVSGAGSVTYAGDPKTVNRNVSGVGTITKKTL